MNEYRLTKYNPSYRTETGVYTRDEWTSFSDIGRSYNGVELTSAEYERVEDSYITATVKFLIEAGIPQLIVRGLENVEGRAVSFVNGDSLTIKQIPNVLRQILREEVWCRLEAANAFVHIGYDYYMYIGVPRPCPTARREAHQIGLYVEDFESPYHSDLDHE